MDVQDNENRKFFEIVTYLYAAVDGKGTDGPSPSTAGFQKKPGGAVVSAKKLGFIISLGSQDKEPAGSKPSTGDAEKGKKEIEPAATSDSGPQDEAGVKSLQNTGAVEENKMDIDKVATSDLNAQDAEKTKSSETDEKSANVKMDIERNATSVSSPQVAKETKTDQNIEKADETTKENEVDVKDAAPQETEEMKPQQNSGDVEIEKKIGDENTDDSKNGETKIDSEDKQPTGAAEQKTKKVEDAAGAITDTAQTSGKMSTKKDSFKDSGDKPANKPLDLGGAAFATLSLLQDDSCHPIDEEVGARAHTVSPVQSISDAYPAHVQIEETVFGAASLDIEGPSTSGYRPQRHMEELKIQCDNMDLPYRFNNNDCPRAGPSSPVASTSGYLGTRYPYDSYLDDQVAGPSYSSMSASQMRLHMDEEARADAARRYGGPRAAGYGRGRLIIDDDEEARYAAARAEHLRRPGGASRPVEYKRFSRRDDDNVNRAEAARKMGATPKPAGYGRGNVANDEYDAARVEAARKMGAIPKTYGSGRRNWKDDEDSDTGPSTSRKSRRDGKSKKKSKDDRVNRCCNSRQCQCTARRGYGREIAHKIFEKAVGAESNVQPVRPQLRARVPNIVVHPPPAPPRGIVQELWDSDLSWYEPQTSRGGFGSDVDYPPRSHTPAHYQDPVYNYNYYNYESYLDTPPIIRESAFPVSDFDGVLQDDKFTEADVAVLVSMHFNRKRVIHSLRLSEGDRLAALKILRAGRTYVSVNKAVWNRTDDPPPYPGPSWEDDYSDYNP